MKRVYSLPLRGAALRAPSPGMLQGSPSGVGHVVSDLRHAALAPPGSPSSTATTQRPCAQSRTVALRSHAPRSQDKARVCEQRALSAASPIRESRPRHDNAVAALTPGRRGTCSSAGVHSPPCPRHSARTSDRSPFGPSTSGLCRDSQRCRRIMQRMSRMVHLPKRLKTPSSSPRTDPAMPPSN